MPGDSPQVPALAFRFFQGTGLSDCGLRNAAIVVDPPFERTECRDRSEYGRPHELPRQGTSGTEALPGAVVEIDKQCGRRIERKDPPHRKKPSEQPYDNDTAVDAAASLLCARTRYVCRRRLAPCWVCLARESALTYLVYSSKAGSVLPTYAWQDPRPLAARLSNKAGSKQLSLMAKTPFRTGLRFGERGTQDEVELRFCVSRIRCTVCRSSVFGAVCVRFIVYRMIDAKRTRTLQPTFESLYLVLNSVFGLPCRVRCCRCTTCCTTCCTTWCVGV